jgi:hypothetical protein
MRRASPAPARLATRDATRIEKRQSAAADWNITHGYTAGGTPIPNLRPNLRPTTAPQREPVP